MIAKNLLVTFLGFLVALTAYFNMQSGIKENFLGMSGVVAKATPQMVTCGTNGSGQTPLHCGKKYPTFTVAGTYQSNLSARMNPNSYSANINYNAPANKYLAVPRDPRTFANQVKKTNIKENFKHNQGLTASVRLDESAPSLPTGTMDGTGAPTNSPANYICDRFYTALAKSRSMVGADYIRGSLAVAPQPRPCMSQAWGIPWQASNPQDHMVLGALSVMGGSGSEQSQALNTFVQQSSGGAMTTAGGVPNPLQRNTSIGQAMSRNTFMKASASGPQNTISATQF